MNRIQEPTAGPREFADPAFQRELTGLLRQARWGGAIAGEVLATASRIHDGDPESWVSEWVWTAGEAWAAANAAAAMGRTRRVAARYLQAAGYYGVALSQIARTSEQDRAAELWRRHRFCWDEAVDAMVRRPRPAGGAARARAALPPRL